MSAETETTPSSEAPAGQRTFLGHPLGLFVLFGAEMWERFCFYGMRTLLVLYMTDKVRGFGYQDDPAYGVYGSYLSLVYLTPLIGGLLADRLLGYRRAIMLGAVLMSLGEFSLLVKQPFFFFGGLSLLILGNGLFKPNISTLVGKLYPEGDPRRDSGFTIFYMGINVGAFLSTAACGYLGESKDWGWEYGYGLAGIGMLAGLAIFGMGKDLLGGHGLPPSEQRFRKSFPLVVLGCLAAAPVVFLLLQHFDVVRWLLLGAGAIVLATFLFTAFREEPAQRDRIFVILVLIVFHMLFWAFYEQTGSSLNLYTERNVQRMLDLPGKAQPWEFPTTWGQSINPFFILVLTPFFVYLWPWLDRRRLNPSIPNKFTLGLLQVGLGYLVIVLASWYLAHAGLVPLWTIVLLYFLHTSGEMCLSPIGLSMITKLAPQRMAGLAMGAWFLSIAGGQALAATIAKMTGSAGGEGGQTLPPTETLPVYAGVYWNVFLYAMAATALCFCLSPILKRWLHGVK